MVYRILAEDRKPVIAKLRELVGDRLIYTRVPRCAYEVDGISVEKDGTVIAREDADMELINTLESEGFIEWVPGYEEPADTSEEAATPHINISLPIANHTGSSLRNLVYAIYARGSLLSKATGGTFKVHRELIDKLKAAEPEDVKEIIGDGIMLQGVQITRDQVIFTGFPETDDPKTVQIFMQLAASINKAALEQKRIQAKKVQDENEKYALRTWMVRIGMGGAQYKEARNWLLKDLTGSSAFRTEAEKERWLKRLKERKEARHAVSE